MFQIDNYRVGGQTYTVKCFPIPQDNEIDFEVWNDEGEYVATVTSNRPDLSTSVLWKYLNGIPTDAVTFVSTWGN